MDTTFRSFQVNNISTHICTTEKYKTNNVSLYIRQPLDSTQHTKTSLLPHVLLRGSQKYPTSEEISKALDDLYGATLSSDVLKRGEEQWIVFRLQIANERYLTDNTPIFEKGMELLREIVLNPLVENEAFSAKHVALEKELLKQKLIRLKDEKIQYASTRCVEEMYPNEPFRLKAMGDLDQVESITPAELFEHYAKVMQTHPVELFFIGDLEEHTVRRTIETHLTIPRRDTIALHPPVPHQVRELEQVIMENDDLSQGKLHIGCSTPITYSNNDYIALLVGNGVFGGFPHSKLFRNVREKESLAYYVSSFLEGHKGLLMIVAGIQFELYDQAVHIIKEQLESVKQGDISDIELAQTKAVLTHQIREHNDNPFKTMEGAMNDIMSNTHRSTEDWIKQINDVSVEDIQRAFQSVQMDTLYFLRRESEVPSA